MCPRHSDQGLLPVGTRAAVPRPGPWDRDRESNARRLLRVWGTGGIRPRRVRSIKDRRETPTSRESTGACQFPGVRRPSRDVGRRRGRRHTSLPPLGLFALPEHRPTPLVGAASRSGRVVARLQDPRSNRRAFARDCRASAPAAPSHSFSTQRSRRPLAPSTPGSRLTDISRSLDVPHHDHGNGE